MNNCIACISIKSFGFTRAFFILRSKVITEGEIYEKATEMSEKAGMRRPIAVILVNIEKIYSLKPGLNAEKKIS
ncbi:MAG: hypothetical protein K9J27_11110 [Bacteroidales bacterium]|nr:hypothetical protein [Bacteroidales bacterium]MCF8334340.1 hypothetical protein [Bacteroidales bacterium]